MVRAHIAAKQHELPLIIGTELNCGDGLKLVVLATDRASYGAMSRLISRARRASPKGRYALARIDLEDALPGCLIIWLPRSDRASAQRQEADGRWLRERFAGRLWLGVELLTGGFDLRRLELLEALGESLDVPRVAAGDVHMHRRSRRALQDVLTAIRMGMPLQAVGYALYSRTASAVCGPCSACASCIPRRCLSKRWQSPSAALSSSTSCATSIPRKSCPPAPLPRVICAP